MRRTSLAIVTLLTLGPPLMGHAESPTPEADPAEAPFVPVVVHAPVHRAQAGEPLTLKAVVRGDWTLGPIVARYRPRGTTAFFEAPFARKGDRWVARIDGAQVGSAGIEYAIESKAKVEGGAPRAHFATLEAPHVVQVAGESPADRTAERLAAYGGHRARLALRGEGFAYGAVLQGGGQTDRFSDGYWRAEAEYTYRTLGDALHDFRFGVGVMRGTWPTVDGETLLAADEPGINYGFGEINVELLDWLSVGGRLLLGASDRGFVAGGGGVLRLGNMAGTHFSAEVETVADVGTRTDLRLHWDTVPHVPMALGLELTDWPSGDEARDAANLSYDIGYAFDGGLTLMARVGSAKRSESLNGGWQAGLGVNYDF